jgi:hypothetical protein
VNEGHPDKLADQVRRGSGPLDHAGRDLGAD